MNSIRQKKGFPPLVLIIILFALPSLLIALEKNKYNKLLERRNEELLQDYPKIISKLSLLVVAGMTINNALIRIVNDYHLILGKSGTKRPAYEELALTCSQIKNGTYETFAYEELGRRIGLPCYIKLSSILISGLKRGSSDFNRHLKEEASAAIIERKTTILLKSSRASSKLLAPMMMIFLVIMLLVMIPAFFSMGF